MYLEEIQYEDDDPYYTIHKYPRYGNYKPVVVEVIKEDSDLSDVFRG